MAFYLWQGKFLVRNGKFAIDERCCCGAGGCFGRLLPGPESLEGAAYFPLVLSATLTAGTCSEPATPLDFAMTWNAANLRWESVDPLVIGPRTSCLVWATCSGAYDRFVWGLGICNCADSTDNVMDGDQNPLDVSAEGQFVGLMCCGNLGGGTMTLRLYE